MEEADREFSELLRVDMAAAKMAAMISPEMPEGNSWTMKMGKIRSVWTSS